MSDKDSFITDLLVVAGGSTATYYLLRWILGKPCGWGIECPIPDVFPFSYLRETYCPKIKEKALKAKEEEKKCKESCLTDLIKAAPPETKPEDLIAVEISKEQYDAIAKNTTIPNMKNVVETQKAGVSSIFGTVGSLTYDAVLFTGKSIALSGITLVSIVGTALLTLEIGRRAVGFVLGRPVYPTAQFITAAIAFTYDVAQGVKYYIIGRFSSRPIPGESFKTYNEEQRSKQKTN